VTTPPQPPKFPFPTHNVQELVAWQPPKITPIIDKGILLPQTRLVVVGMYKAWKSMLAMNMSYAIAMGHSWLGYQTNSSDVLCFQYEIPHALLRERVLKYSQAASQWPTNLTFVTPHHLKLDRDYALPIMDLYLNHFRPRVLVIDPIYKALSGDVSSSFDVSKFIDNMDIIREKHNVAIILVHHERKQQFDASGNPLDHGSQDMMGSSYIPNWLDTMVQLDRITDTEVRLSFPTMRHAIEEMPTHNLRFSHETLGASIITGGHNVNGLNPDVSYLASEAT
jgi:RecA-family ATPase